MRVSLTGLPLNATGIARVRQIVRGDLTEPRKDRAHECADAVVSHALDLGAKYAILETPYIDRDYSADYINFYAGAFRDYPRHTKRLHFFGEDVSAKLLEPLAEQIALMKSAVYLGNVVVRPIAQGPVGRTTLGFPDLGAKLVVRPAARASFTAHIMGGELNIEAVAPFIQQDTRLGTCAQAAIWMASRAVHQRHRRTTWHSIAEITRLATNPIDAELSTSLPAGSGGLDPIHIIRALRAMGHQPLFDYFADEANGKRDTTAAAAATVRYLDSGLPVILALEKIGHAMTAVGLVETNGSQCREGPCYDTFVRALVVHDDQRGPYRLMPLTSGDIQELPSERLLRADGKILTVEDAVSHLFVPLPPRVLLRADRADTVAKDFLSRYVADIGDGMLKRVRDIEPSAVPGVEAFHKLVAKNTLVRRTYLTSAGRYRHHLAHSALPNIIKSELITRHLPHFVWVTELVEPDAKPKAGGARPMIGHLVMSATSSSNPNNDLLMASFPHVVIQRDINPPPDAGVEFLEKAEVFAEHAEHCGRLRK